MWRRTRGQAIVVLGWMVLLGGSVFGLVSRAAAQPQWASTGELLAPRRAHTLTLLPSGKVLAVGGLGVVRTELYDPATGTWETTGALGQPRERHTATLLPSGQVLVVGGSDGVRSLAEAELYNPATGTWLPTGALVTPREDHTATLLASGDVLVVGGLDSVSGHLASAEIYASGTWTQLPSMLTDPRSLHTATLLKADPAAVPMPTCPDGTTPDQPVLVVGGFNNENVFSQALASAELYDPCTRSWSPADGLDQPRSNHTATLLASGQVLAIGGSDLFSPLASLESYDPLNDLWTPPGPSLGTARQGHSATLLASGEVLLAGGSGAAGFLAGAEVFDSGVTATASLAAARDRHAAVLLPSGKVLVAGGQDADGSLRQSELFDPDDGIWSDAQTVSAASSRQVHTATLLASGQVLVAGGSSMGAALATAELYTPAAPATSRWALTAGNLQSARRFHTATLLSPGAMLASGVVPASGAVLLAGGDAGAAPLQSSELYNPDDGTWSFTTGSMATARRRHTATRLASGEVLVVAGFDGSQVLSSAELYDPLTGAWSPTGVLTTEPRASHTATLLLTGQVLVAGGYDQDSVVVGNPMASAELYDPESGTWWATDAMNTARSFHTATLLASGKVLVVAGESFEGNEVTSAELYDPATGTWSVVRPLTAARRLHAATHLLDGRVLVTGGETGGTVLSGVELYEPASDTWSTVGAMTVQRLEHTSTLLPSGEVLTVGSSADAELYDPVSRPAARRPVITSVSPAPLTYADAISVTGTGFDGDSEAGGGTSSASSVDYPVVQLRDTANGRQFFVPPLPLTSFASDPLTRETTLQLDHLPPVFDPGLHLVTVFVAGVPSNAHLAHFECSLVIEQQPAAPVPLPPVGSTATFSVQARGARAFQWSKDSTPIDGATGPTYTTPPLSGADSGSKYKVEVSSGCMKLLSSEATLTVFDNTPPSVSVVTPNGQQDFWTFGTTESVVWSMSDDIRICRVEVELIWSDDGVTFPADCTGDCLALQSFGTGGACAHPGVDDTTYDYDVPATPPSGSLSSLYKVRVRVIDHAGNPAEASSQNSFSIVQPNDESVRTLVLWHSGRMAGDTSVLATKLQDLAEHDLVQGRVIDLAAGFTELDTLYASWDVADTPGSADPAAANDVLFAAGGVHDVLRGRLVNFTAVQYLLLVGGDPVIPMARFQDGTVQLTELTYPTPTTDPAFHPDLTPDTTTVGRALAADFYLSDDPLAFVAGDVAPNSLDGDVFLPELAVGRLVETPGEIVRAIATFLSQDGVADLSQLDAATGHKVHVSGYDFLLDSASRIRELWKGKLEMQPFDDTSLEPVDGLLISQDWGVTAPGGGKTVNELREELLRGHLAGNGGERYLVASLNSHATHYQAGVPGRDGPHDIQGLSAIDVYGPDVCATPSAGALDLAGSVVYSVGCHSGLPVSGSCATDADPANADNALDLPQTMLSRGVQFYVANTGYGWGLSQGIGYGERLVELLTEEMTRGGTVVMGEAVKTAKTRYFLETPRFDAYDEKSVMQWTVFGFPMYALRTAIGQGARQGESTVPFAGPAPRLEELPETERYGAVAVRRGAEKAVPTAGKALPRYLTRLELTFDFTADGVYTKRDSLGQTLTPGVPGCADANGCYYTLNGVVERGTGEVDQPIQPMFIFDSRLSGTSQHGVLWKGGQYDQETGWRPVFAELQSNAVISTDRNAAPRHHIAKPNGRRPSGTEGPDCRPTDLETNSLVVATGEVLAPPGAPWDPDDPATYSVQRIYRTIDFELFYFNNTGVTGTGNCDRGGPVIDPGPFMDDAYHQVTGTILEWAVPVRDRVDPQDPLTADEVWRVLVVFNRGSTDTPNGLWEPLELVDDGSGTWRGTLDLTGVGELTYMVQAVDLRGNVSWLEFQSAAAKRVPKAGTCPDPGLPASCVPLQVPLPVDVELATGLIFEDGFETGDATRWSTSTP